MYIKWMHIENYRNLADVTLSFHNDINYFVGENAVGKSNFLDLLEIIMDCHGFIESDFTDVNKPIRIDFEISLGELNYKSMYTADEGPTYRLRLEQVVQEVYPRLYRVTDAEIEPMPLSMIRHALYVCHRDTSEQELFSIPSSIYVELGQLLQAYVSRLEMPTDDFQREIVSLRKDLDPYCMLNIQHLVEVLSTSSAMERKYSADNVRLIMAVALKILAQIYMKVSSATTNLESLLVYDAKGYKFLPIFISVDEPELHLSPYLQRAVLNYYRQIATNENEEFLALLRDIFKIDGLLGQLFVVTHSTDALVDDYRHIIRLYRDENNMVCAACGVTFNFPKEVEKHLIMHFPEAKEALYARCIIIVEGETEYGSFTGFGKKLGVDFDYFGICLINARGESSISKLQKLFNRFSIPTVALYDRDVEGKYAKAHSNIFYTQEICFEMDFVSYLLAMHKRSIMDAIIKDIIDDARPMVTKDMARRGYAKLGITKSQIVQRCLPNISDRKLDDLHIYYFSWFFANKGVIVGRRISQFLDASMIPPAFIAVIERAKLLSLGLG
ncbi:MAG: AAA family ATPase [Veillonella sp.]|uniref:ATP-dependent nuclease n=1 Tax=unclassified Veillonella TaxID=2630086 RepID=UPI000CF4E5F0|nr:MULTISPECIES: AAA family ATPase [unclassified Veillonella]MBS5066584.1 AAA family ATPase [Veillonella sp.]MDU1827229.1 AAA family ATPase [Veillonella sp.]MDU4006500.1 AAA family ATPase [Veillonella sp.]MDU6497136.1 AAA family ATPase [Veillonella sp.]PQL14916.1 ATP-dependent endonuclease [Veillonella sp. S13054-11]